MWPVAGIGYQWWEGSNSNFRTEIGTGWVFEDFRHEDSRDHFAGRLSYHYDKKLRNFLSLFHNLEYLPSLEDGGDFNLNVDAGMRVPLVRSFFTEFKLEWKHDSRPAKDAEKNDERYIISVGWKFE